jgi:hypothetical protein
MNNIVINLLKSKDPKYKKLSDILHYLFNLGNISQDKYLIIGSYGMRSLRNINDLDVCLDTKEFFKLKVLIDQGFGILQIHNNQIRWFYDLTNLYNELNCVNVKENDFSIEVYQSDPWIGFPDDDFSLNSVIQNNQYETDWNGHKYFDTQTLLRWKSALGRPKDLADIMLIQNALNK